MAPKNHLWTIDRELVLIEFFRDHDFLWNLKNKNHKSYKTSAILDTLVDKLEGIFSRQEILMRFTSLKTNFFANLKKTQKSKTSGTDEEYMPTFVHYKALSFLHDPSVSTQSKTAIKQDTLDFSPDPLAIDLYVDETTFEKFDDEQPGNSKRSAAATFEDATANYQSHNLSREANEPSLLSAKQLKQSFNGLNGHEQPTVAIVGTVQGKEDNDDPQCFGDHVAHKLRHMDSFSRARAQLAIEQVLFEYHPNNPNKT